MEQLFSSESHVKNYGFSALYDVCMCSHVSAGIVLYSKEGPNRSHLFELAEDIELLSASTIVKVLPGSLIANDFNGDGWYADSSVVEVLLSSCRFPTKKEFEDYEKIGGV